MKGYGFIMKKFLCTAIMVFGFIMITSCGRNGGVDYDASQTVSYSTERIDVGAIKNSGVGVYSGKVISDSNTALEYAKLILRNTLKEDVDKYKTVNITYDSEQRIWNVNFGIDNEILGGGKNILLSEDNGEVLLIFENE